VKVLDLFSGIGGFSLGLERAGMKTVAFCEIEEFPRKVLKKHWPEVPIYEDVRTLTAARLAADGISVDVICGGFPCQDISNAGSKAGITGERSGLWKEYARLIGEIRPKFVIVENVSALLGRGLERVLGDLAQVGYDAEWHCIPASAVGAPHRRDRIWIVAYPQSIGFQRRGYIAKCEGIDGADGKANKFTGNGLLRVGEVMANAIGGGRQGPGAFRDASNQKKNKEREATEPFDGGFGNIWSVEPNVGRVANGVSNRSHRLKCLGNAVIPQIPEIIGRAIMAMENQ